MSERDHTSTHQVTTTPAGLPTVAVGPHFLEDPEDPEAGARAFVESSDFLNAKVVVLFGVGLGYRVRALSDAGVKSLVVFEPEPELARACREFAPDVFAAAKVFTDSAPMTEHLIQRSFSGDRTVLLVPPAYRRAFPDAHQQLVTSLNEAEGLKQLRKNTFMQRFNLILEAALQNLTALADVPLYHTLGRPLEGSPAFIVSAGPSLDKNGSLLCEAARRGAVFTVNTAAPAVTAYGAPIDVLTCIESVDVTASLAPAAANSRILALDLSANPKNYLVDVPHKVAFMPTSDPFHSLGEIISAPTLPYGASVATAAFALARAWGADPIVLVGQDLAYTGGQVYAKHTGRGELVAHDRGAHLELEYSPEMLASFRAHGIQEPPRLKPAVRVPAWGGGEIATAHDMVLFLRWFETAAHDIGDRRRMINATEGGVRIEGFEEKALSDVLEELPVCAHRLDDAIADAQHLGAKRVETVRRDLHRSAKAIAKAARRCMTVPAGRPQRKADAALRKAASKNKFVDLHASPTLINVRDDKTLDLGVRRSKTFGAIEASAKRIARLAS